MSQNRCQRGTRLLEQRLLGANGDLMAFTDGAAVVAIPGALESSALGDDANIAKAHEWLQEWGVPETSSDDGCGKRRGQGATKPGH